jgi:predicted amidophosphoribosyltransferase
VERRQTPEEIQALYQVDSRLLMPRPTEIAIVDDVLTTGAHFRIMNAHLESAFPEVRIVGMFIARRALGPHRNQGPISD